MLNAETQRRAEDGKPEIMLFGCFAFWPFAFFCSSLKLEPCSLKFFSEKNLGLAGAGGGRPFSVEVKELLRSSHA